MESDTLQLWKAEFFKALGHPARIKILEYLRAGERPAGNARFIVQPRQLQTPFEGLEGRLEFLSRRGAGRRRLVGGGHALLPVLEPRKFVLPAV